MNLREQTKSLGNSDPIRGQWGYTLIEVILAIFILVVVLLMLSEMTVMLIRVNHLNDLMDIATDLSQDKLEELKNAFPASSILADVNTGNNGDLESTSDVDFQESNIDGLGQAGGIFSRIWNIADNNPSSGMKAVVVIVSWTDQMGSHKVMLRTIL